MQIFDNITPIILAGGKGTRLRSVVSDRPKILAEVNGKPFIFYLFDQLINAGFHNVVLCTGYMSEMVKNVCKCKYKDLAIGYSEEKTPLGTGGAIINALKKVKTQYILILNGDSYCEINLNEFINAHFSYSIHGISIAINKVDDVSRYGKVIIGANCFIESFEEKTNIKSIGLINSGIYLINKTILNNYVQKIYPISIEKDIFPEFKNKIFAYESKGKFIDIGTPESYRSVGEYLK